MSSPLRKMFQTDTDVEREGLWLEYAEGLEIKIARAGGSNKRFAKVMARLAKPHRRAIQTEVIDEGILREMFIKAYSQAVILDWKGVTKDAMTGDDADAEEVLAFNLENCMGVMRALPELFADVMKAADNITLFRSEIMEEDSKN